MGADTIGTEGGVVINLDDLTDPVLTDVQRKILDYTESHQVEFDLDALQKATGRLMSDEERARAAEVQHQAMRWTFLGSGMTHPNFLASLEAMGPELRARIETVAPAFC